MKMTKRLILPVMFLFASTSIIKAQGLFFTFSPGYHFPAGKTTNTDYFPGSFNYGASGNKDEALRLSFGKGITIGASGGFMFNENLGMELGLSYLMGGKYEAEGSMLFMGSTVTANATYYGRMFRIAPTLIMMTGEDMKWYMRFGPVFGVGTKVITESEGKSGNNTSTQTSEFTGGLSTGIMGGFGFSTPISESMSFFAELQGITQSWSPAKMTVTESTTDGKDDLADMDKADKETEFEDEVTVTGPQDPNQPTKATKITIPFSSFGLQIGIRFNLGQ